MNNLVSPRIGIVFHPVENMSIYASYSVSYLPASGDQFNCLTTGTVDLEPEKFVNKEVGFKWDITPRLLTQRRYTNSTGLTPLSRSCHSWLFHRERCDASAGL